MDRKIDSITTLSLFAVVLFAIMLVNSLLS